MEQINLLEQLEQEQKAEQRFQEHTRLYHEWLNLPKKILVKEGTPERENLTEELWYGYCSLYKCAHHECPNMPPDKYIWLNPTQKDYWVLATHGVIESKHITECPYCGTKLSEGKGDAVLYKCEPKYWLFYLYYEVPMHERGYQTPEERQKIKEVWG